MNLEIWTLYDHPSDFPDCFVARLYMNGRATPVHHTAPTLDELRAKLPPHLFRIERDASDDKVIVESWL